MTRRRRSRTKSSAAGFTMLEAMMTLLVMIIGILGMGAMAAASIRTNQEAQDATRALNLADMLVGRLRTEAGQWDQPVWNPSLDVPDDALHMPLLRRMTLGAGPAGVGWADLTKNLGGSTQAFTRDLALVPPNDGRAKFCVHYNLTWLQLNETMRADVRVYWLRRRSVDANGLRADCGAGAATALARDAETVRSVTRTTVLSRIDRGRP